MPKKNRAQILSDKLDKLEQVKQYRINKYIKPIESDIFKTKEQIKKHYKIYE